MSASRCVCHAISVTWSSGNGIAQPKETAGLEHMTLLLQLLYKIMVYAT